MIFRTIRRILFKIGKKMSALYSASQAQYTHILSARTMTDVAQLRTLFVKSLQVLEINRRK